MRQNLGFNFFDVFVVLFITVFALICFYPLWYVFVVSIMPYDVFVKTKLVLLPHFPPDLTYYKGILTSASFQRSFMVSVEVTVLGTALCLLATSAMAYAVSKSDIKGMKVLNLLVIFTMFFSGGLIPTFFLYRDLHLLGNFWVMVLPGGLAAGQFVIMRNYFAYSVPTELEEASRIDGANDIVAFFRIVLPLSTPMLAAVGLFIGVSLWNDYAAFLYYGQNNYSIQPLMWALRRMLTESGFSQSVQQGAESMMGLPKIPAFSLRMATIICSILPILCVYPFLQKYFAKGILIGAVKG